MGRRPDPQLEQRRLDRSRGRDRRPDRHPDRRRARRGLDRRLDLGQPVQGTERLRGPAEGRRAGAHHAAFGAQQLSDRPVHRRERRHRRRAEAAPGRGRRPRRQPDQRRRAADADARQLPQRPHPRHGRADADRPCGRRADGLGPGALGRRGAGRSARGRRRLRGRLRLQVPERRPRRAGLRLGPSAAHRAHGSRRPAPAALRLARPCGAVRVRARPTGRPAASIASSAARRRSWRCARSSAASRCSAKPRRSAAWRRCATSRSPSPRSSSSGSKRAAPASA